jgi:RNA polymerase sigma-70 factor (ECF subfamily)
VTEVDETTEALAKQACERGDFEGAATIVYDAYGREIYSFLLSQFQRSSGADDVFSQFNEDFWRGLPRFGWRCSIRAWCYQLARNASHRHRRSPHNDGRRHLPLGSSSWAAKLLETARTSTRPHLKTEIKDEFQRLRDKLTREDQDLLILRVDRGLSWHDVAHAMLSAEQATDHETLRRKELALRQRYSEVKKRLRLLAIEAGLLSRGQGCAK